MNENSNFLRLLPSVDAVLQTATARNLKKKLASRKLTELARAVVADLRAELQSSETAIISKLNLLEAAENRLSIESEKLEKSRFQRVINATGVCLHTNLGRAPLSAKAIERIGEIARGYCTLEYDLMIGKRGKRGIEVEKLLCELTGAEAALVVNNCAAAAFLVLTALGAGGEGVVSRGELVEIGGDFRVPDIMAQSGVKLVEVGTTNRTRLQDFAAAITENTKLIVRVHPSNFRIVGFTAMPNLGELSDLARERNVILYEDAGSGALFDARRFGFADEPVIPESIKSGADVVSFSGDKLLGGAQAGIIVGKFEVIEKLRKHPLYRALRVDKIIAAALAATLESFLHETHLQEIPVWRMLAQTVSEIEQRSADFVKKTAGLKLENWNFELRSGVSAVGGGSAPLAALPTILIAIEHQKIAVAELEKRLRLGNPPIIARIADDRLLLDLRTVAEAEIDEILTAFQFIGTEIADAV